MSSATTLVRGDRQSAANVAPGRRRDCRTNYNIISTSNLFLYELLIETIYVCYNKLNKENIFFLKSSFYLNSLKRTQHFFLKLTIYL